jgi:hypothetical protein
MCQSLEKEFIHEVAKCGNRRPGLKSASPRTGFRNIHELKKQYGER